jgi:predicted dehydrogenase
MAARGQNAADLRQAWPRPSRPRPVIFIGAGAIVRGSHLPAYARIGVPTAGVYDISPETSRATADAFSIPRVFSTLEDAAGEPGVVFDVAVPGAAITSVLSRLPPGAAVLIQKPMGEDLESAGAILEICRERKLVAAINFQLRFSPNILAIQDLLARRFFGTLTDVEVRIAVRQPWENWPFMRGIPRVEVLYHSIHYLDTIRRLAGEPRGAYCKVVGHPDLPELRDPRSSIILDYGDAIRCSLALNHTHRHDMTHRASWMKVEGTAGAAIASMGVNLEYPNGLPDRLEISESGGGWTDVPLRGSWFTEAFEGPMSNLQRFVTGEDDALVSPVDDAIRTMAVVEACYQSSAAGGTPIPGAE